MFAKTAKSFCVSASILLSAVFAPLIVSSITYAGPTGGTTLGSLSPLPSKVPLGPGVSYAFPSSLESGGVGDVSVVRYSLGGSYRFPSEPGSFLILNGNYEYADYNWSDEDLIEGAHRLGLSAVGLRRIAQSKWGLFGFGQISAAAEQTELLGKGLSATLITGPAYSFSRDFTLTIGVLANVQPERSARVFPVASINWRINDEWNLRTLNGAILTYIPVSEERLQLDLSTEYRTRGIRLQRQLLPNGSMGRPMADEREIAAGIALGWRVRQDLVVRGFAEYLVARRWEFREDRTRFKTVEAANTAQLGLRFDYLF